jgi:hypothetical protein
MSLGLGSTESTEPLVRTVANQRLEPETDRVSIRLGARGGASLAQEALIDV